MLIARYDPADFSLQELITSFARFTRAFPSRSWVDPVQNSQLIAQDVPARVVREVAGPALTYGEHSSYTAERQPDGAWLQVWSTRTLALADAKFDLLAKADALVSERMPVVNQVLLQVFMEFQVAETEVAAGMTPAAVRYPMIDAIAQDRAITLVQAGQNVVKPLRDAWKSEAEKYLPRYTNVVERIKAAATIADAKAIFDELGDIQ